MGKHKRFSGEKMMACFAAGYWKPYGKLRRGWREKYAAYMLKKVKNGKDWQKERKLLREWLEENEPEMMERSRFFFLKLKLLRFRIFCGAQMGQDSLDQIHTPYRVIRRLVTNKRTNFIADRTCTKDMMDLCNDKVRAAGYWDAWLDRNWTELSPEHPMTGKDLERVLNGKTKLVVKPVASFGGIGVEVVDTAERFTSPEECLEYLNGLEKRYIVEEFVEQKGFIHTLNPSSVNTVRIVTVRRPDGKIEVMNAFLRVGREGSPVDNVTSGGWFYVIDHRTGMMRKGRDEHGQCIPGYREGKDPAPVPVPRWEETVEFCRSAHRHAPDGLDYVGWDVCISDDGVRMIEINVCPGWSQPYSRKEYPWKEMRKLLDEFE